jgi:hypothetical protein
MANAGKSTGKLTVLYSESDAEVLTAQAVSVQKAGHQVVTAVGRKAVEEALRRNNFDFVILGGTLSRNDRHHLPYMVKKASTETKVLVMHTDGERHPYVDGNIDTGRSIDEIVAMATKMSANAQAPAAGRAKSAVAGK